MTSNKPLTSPTIKEVIKKYSSMTVQEYTTTLYNSKGKLLDDGIDANADKLNWAAFIDVKQARELADRLAMIEREGMDDD